LSFRQNNEMQRKWHLFWQANKDLMEQIGLPGTITDTWDRFADFLMHGHLDHHDDPLKFGVWELRREKVELLKRLVDNYFAAGFPDPGITVTVVGGQQEYLRLVRKYPNQFGPRTVEIANEQSEE